MSFFLIKKIMIASRAGRCVDAYMRLILSSIPLFHSLLSQFKKKPHPDFFVLFLYGGVGDAILTLPLIDKLSSISKVVIFCDEKLGKLSFLLPNNVKVLIYQKNGFLKNILECRNQISAKNAVFVQTSPVFEMYVIRILLKIPRAIGLISNYKTIRSIGFYVDPVNIDSCSRVSVYARIYDQIIRSFFKEKLNALSPDKRVSSSRSMLPQNGIHGKKYIVISPTKSAQWKMGKMLDAEYAKLAEFLSQSCGYKVIFVGHHTEVSSIDKIINKTAGSPMIINMAGSTNLENLSALILGAEFVIANDNGVSHLSSYLSVKTVVLFMFSDPEVYRWDHINYAYIFNPEYRCMPCVGVNKYPKDNYPVLCGNNVACNKTITAKTVIKKLKELKWIDPVMNTN